MATATQMLLVLACLPTLSIARRKMVGAGKVITEQAAAGKQASSWDYSTAKTAWDVLCHDRAAGVFFAEWKESGCFAAPFCHHLKVKCDPDERVQTIKVTYGRFTSHVYDLPKSATPSTSDGLSFRFFLNSEGCDYGKGAGDEECDLPWEPYDEERNTTKVAKITRRFLHYDARKEGARALTVEKSVYEAWFYKSELSRIGVGMPLPAEFKFAGSTGTGCTVGKNECSTPVDGPEPVLDTTVLDVTTNYVSELPGMHKVKEILHSGPAGHPIEVERDVDFTGYVTIFKNRNWAKTSKTKVWSFELK